MEGSPASAGAAEDDAGAIVGGVLICLVFVAVHAYALFWWKRKGGKELVMGKVAERIKTTRVLNVEPTQEQRDGDYTPPTNAVMKSTELAEVNV